MNPRVSDLLAMSGQGQAVLEVFGVLRRRRVIFNLALVITAIVATVVSFIRPPVYEASSTVITDKTPPVVLLPSTTGAESSLVKQPLAQAPDAFTLTELAKSEAVRDAATNRLALFWDPKLIKQILTKSLRVQQVRSTDLVRVSVRYRDPQLAAAVANAVAESVVEQDLKARRRQATISREFIGRQLEVTGRELQASRHALAAFKRGSGDVSLGDETQLNLHRLDDLQAALTDIRQQEQQASVGFTRPLGGPRPGTSQAFPDPVITTLQSQLAALEVEYSGLRKQFTPLHPQVQSTQARIDETQRRLSDEIFRKRAALSSREQYLTAEIGKLEQTLLQVPTQEALLARLTMNTKDAERTYLQLSEKFQEARIAEGSVGSAVRLVDVAKVPPAPVGPHRRTAVVFGILFGLLMGVGSAYAMELAEHTVTSVKDAERLMGVPALGTVPLTIVGGGVAVDEATRPALLTQLDPTSGASEAFRMLRTRLLQAMRTAEATCTMFTSALSGEGKSTVVANLAVSTAQTDRHVWLLDCNLRHPTLERLFPEAGSPGLSAYLGGRAELEEVVRPTHQPRLACIVGGSLARDPAELLDTRLMARALAQARERADIVLLDGPTAGAVTDADVVGLRADAAVFVVQLNKTDRFALRRARERLHALSIRVLGLVVNQAPSPSPATLREIWKDAGWRTRATMLLARLR